MFIEFEKVFHAGVVKVCVDPATCQRVCEELWGVAAEDVYLHEEDPVEREREEVRPQQAVAVDDAAQRLADAAARCDVARREAAEDVRHRVVRQRRGLAHRRPQIPCLDEKRVGGGRWQTTGTEPKGEQQSAGRGVGERRRGAAVAVEGEERERRGSGGKN